MKKELELWYRWKWGKIEFEFINFWTWIRFKKYDKYIPFELFRFCYHKEYWYKSFYVTIVSFQLCITWDKHLEWYTPYPTKEYKDSLKVRK
jgi:hypothetical protein